VLLVFGAPCQRNLLAGQEHGRTIPLGDERIVRMLQRTCAGGASVARRAPAGFGVLKK
jgi:hypothetical protein